MRRPASVGEGEGRGVKKKVKGFGPAWIDADAKVRLGFAASILHTYCHSTLNPNTNTSPGGKRKLRTQRRMSLGSYIYLTMKMMIWTLI